MTHPADTPLPAAPLRWPALTGLVALAALLVWLAAMQGYWPGQPWGGGERHTFNAATLTTERGSTRHSGDAWVVQALDGGAALLRLTDLQLNADSLPRVQWSLGNVQQGTQLQFLWRTAREPQRTFGQMLEWHGNSVAALDLTEDPNWHGTILEADLLVRGALPAPLQVNGVTFARLSPLDILAEEWFGVRPWLGTSVHYIGGDAPRAWLAPLPFAVLVLALAAALLALRLWRSGLRPQRGPLWLLLFAVWLLLDLRWQGDLWHKHEISFERYAGKDWVGKHAAAEDGRLFEMIEQMRTQITPANARVFVFADNDYLRGRAAYHLLPLNVLNKDNLLDLLPAATYRPGDYLIILGRDEVGYATATKTLQWGDQSLHAELLQVVEGSVLLRVL